LRKVLNVCVDLGQDGLGSTLMEDKKKRGQSGKEIEREERRDDFVC
jgi:hypothetical protein